MDQNKYEPEYNPRTLSFPIPLYYDVEQKTENGYTRWEFPPFSR